MFLPFWLSEGQESYTHSLDAKGLCDDLFDILVDAFYRLHDLGRLIDRQYPTPDGRDQP